MKSHPIFGTLLAVLVTGIAAVFGWAVTPDDAMGMAIFSMLAGLDVRVQAGLVVALSMLVLIPALAPYTPWTWDDRTIQYRSQAMKIIASLWNAVAGNIGKASNGPTAPASRQ